jgi:hypothetical protein
MQLQYVKTMPGMPQTIEATLVAGEHLGNHAGPITMFVPEDPANADYADILARNLTIQPAPP